MNGKVKKEVIDFSRKLRGNMRGKNDVGENKKPMDFTCRVCGSNDYKEICNSNGVFSSTSRNCFCICSECSVMFKDPEKFSKK